MRENTVKSLWRAGQITYGGWLSIPDAYAAEAMAQVGFDWLCVDMQHGVIDYRDAVAMLRAVGTTETIPFVRVPWNEQGIIGKVLDAGAYGVIVPMVNSRAEAEAAVAACRYAPGGRRSYGPNRVTFYARADYFRHADEQVACIPMIETATAVQHLDEILSVPGIDAVYVGPADLSITLGLEPRMDNEGAFAEASRAIVAGCVRHGVVAGIHANAKLAAGHARNGYQMITVAADVSGMARAASEDLALVRDVRKANLPSYG
ncbi:MAG: aldolase/citrate lyase family protein [Dehalococcoidia bacterium]